MEGELGLINRIAQLLQTKPGTAGGLRQQLGDGTTKTQINQILYGNKNIFVRQGELWGLVAPIAAPPTAAPHIATSPYATSSTSSYAAPYTVTVDPAATIPVRVAPVAPLPTPMMSSPSMKVFIDLCNVHDCVRNLETYVRATGRDVAIYPFADRHANHYGADHPNLIRSQSDATGTAYVRMLQTLYLEMDRNPAATFVVVSHSKMLEELRTMARLHLINNWDQLAAILEGGYAPSSRTPP